MTTGAKLTVILAVALLLLALVYFAIFVPQDDLPIKAVDPQMSEGQLQHAAIHGMAPTAQQSPNLHTTNDQEQVTAMSQGLNVPSEAPAFASAPDALATLMPPTVAIATVGGPNSQLQPQSPHVVEVDSVASREVVTVTPHRRTRSTGGQVSGVVSNPPAAIEISRAAETGRLYTIQPGDTLSDISLVWFGTSLRWQEIVQANPGLDPKRMRVGHRITLPPKLKDAVPGPSVAAAPPKADVPGTYVVRSGDSLTTIAEQKLGTMLKWQQLWELNREVIGNDPDALKVGMRLKLYK